MESLEETVRDLTADTESTIGPDTMHVKQEQIAQLELTCKTLQEEISQLVGTLATVGMIKWGSSGWKTVKRIFIVKSLFRISVFLFLIFSCYLNIL